jgi:hypothetical protein
MMETASTTSVATPAQDDTLTLVPRDRRGALTGVATDLRRFATRLPHHTPVGVTTAERLHASGYSPSAEFFHGWRPVCPCPWHGGRH